MRRPNSARESQLRGELQKLITAAMPLKSLMEHFDADAWKLTVERLNSRLRNYVRQRSEGFEKMTEIELKVLLAREDELKYVARMPEQCQALLEEILDKQATIRGKLREIKDRSKI